VVAEPSKAAVPANVPVKKVPAFPPRVLRIGEAAHHAGVSTWSVRVWLEAGLLRRVRYPDGNGGELRNLLIDREELNAFIERWRST
jgi:hypothetical protein